MKMKTFLPDLIAAKGMTQQQLAYLSGLSPTTIGKIYRGHFDRIDNHTVSSLCKFFGLKSISQLIDIEWEPHDVEGGKA